MACGLANNSICPIHEGTRQVLYGCNKLPIDIEEYLGGDGVADGGDLVPQSVLDRWTDGFCRNSVGVAQTKLDFAIADVEPVVRIRIVQTTPQDRS